VVNDPCRCASALGFSGSPPRPTPHPRRYPDCHNRTTEILPDGSLKDSDAHETLSNAGFPGFRVLLMSRSSLATVTDHYAYRLRRGKAHGRSSMVVSYFTMMGRVSRYVLESESLSLMLADGDRCCTAIRGVGSPNVSDAASLYCLMKHIS
jgi:hypothetical protein